MFAGRADPKAPTVGQVEQSTEHRRTVEARQTEPIQRTVARMGGYASAALLRSTVMFLPARADSRVRRHRRCRSGRAARRAEG